MSTNIKIRKKTDQVSETYVRGTAVRLGIRMIGNLFLLIMPGSPNFFIFILEGEAIAIKLNKEELVVRKKLLLASNIWMPYLGTHYITIKCKTTI